MKNIYARLCDEIKNKKLVLATIVSTKGSSPQVPGVSALFSDKGLLTGTLGGGIMEARAEEKALGSLQTGRSSLDRFELYADITSEAEAICGGEATILFDAQPADHEITFQEMVRSLNDRKPGILATHIQLTDDRIQKLSRSWIEKSEIFGEEAEKQNIPFREKTKQAFTTGKPVFSKNVYLEPQFPFSHLVIAGAGHVGQAVAHIGYLLDFEVTVIDDRPEFANKEIVPEADHIIVEDIGQAIDEMPKTADTYIVIVTRGHSHDADALKACIRSDVAYIGMIGSGRKIALMREKFIELGWSTAPQFDRVFAPIGIDIQSKTVQEIAVSIAAELVQVRNQVQNSMEAEK
ncbi:MAG: XdhC family protein [Candidatus Aminicenantes bacterium]|nr:MAG: XdhC family protein [Candidatus Aminicenantes bacterium]